MSEEKIVFCTGGGCTAKLGAGGLSRILEKLPRGEQDPNLLVGYDSKDDAAVYRITDDLALVQTVDFFPPMVDDPYTFGQIAAANALSDVYAMGGEDSYFLTESLDSCIVFAYHTESGLFGNRSTAYRGYSENNYLCVRGTVL